MLNIKQIGVVGSVLVLMGILLSMDISALVKSEEEQSSDTVAEATQAEVKQFSLEEVSEISKRTLNANLNKQISNLEGELKNASAAEQVNLYRALAGQWTDVNQPAPAAYYYELIAQKEPEYENWLKAGDTFTDAFQQTMDTLLHPALVEKAVISYTEADKLRPNTPEVKTGLGIAYVSGNSNPMQGINLLLEVVKDDPENLKANLSLGLFSMKSGQFDKAVERFKTVIAQAPTAEAYFYMASSYENLGMKPEAVAAYLKTKEIAADPNMSQFVDRKVATLSN